MPNRTVEFSEFITVRFTERQRGLIRTLPFRTKGSKGTRKVRYTLASASVDGGPTRADDKIDGGDWSVRLGDGNKWLEGRHTFVLRYQVQGALTDIGDDGYKLGPRTEFFWNMLPTHWRTQIPAATITIDFPEPVNDKYAARILFGELGTKFGVQVESDGKTIGDPSLIDAKFTSKTQLVYFIKKANQPGWTTTVILGLPEGTIEKGGANIVPIGQSNDELRDQEVDRWIKQVQAKSNPIGAIFPAIPAILAFLLFKKKHEKPLVVRYDPPVGISAPDAGIIDDTRFDPRDLCAAIISIAQKGYWNLAKVGDSSVIQFVENRKKKPLNDFEQSVYAALAPMAPEVSAETLKTDFRQQFKDLSVQLQQRHDTMSWAPKYAAANGCIGCLIIGMSIPLALVLISFFGFWSLAGIPLAIFVSIFAIRRRSNYNDIGDDIRWQIRGFKEFIRRAHEKELNWMAEKHPDQSVFESLLPFAVAFNLVKEWGQAFEGVQFAPPEWCSDGSNMTMWNYFWISSMVNDYSNEWSDSISDAISTFDSGGMFSDGGSGFGSDDYSSGGGFDGGGSSGDGGGGGGGDSW